MNTSCVIFLSFKIYSLEVLTILVISREAFEVSGTHVTSGDNLNTVPLKFILKRPCGHFARL